MKNRIIMIGMGLLIFTFFAGCSVLFLDIKTDQLIANNKIYIGMSKNQFEKILAPPKLTTHKTTTEKGTEEVWTYCGGFHLNLLKCYTFYFDENNILTRWDRGGTFKPDKQFQ